MRLATTGAHHPAGHWPAIGEHGVYGDDGEVSRSGALPAEPATAHTARGDERFGPERRVRLARDFARVRRAGRSLSGGLVTLGFVQRASAAPESPAQPTTPARVGFIVGKRVGGAVVRNRVRRRLREIMRRRLRALSPGCDLVVIARPSAASATSADLARDLDALLVRARVFAPGREGAEP